MSTTATIIASTVVLYIVATGILTYILRSKTNSQFMVGSRAVPALVVGILLMSEFIGAKSTIGLAQAAFNQGIAAGWSLFAASIGFVLLGFFFVRQIYNSGEITISGVISQRFGHGAQTVVSLIMIYALLLVNVGNFISGAAVLSAALNISLPVASILIAAICAFCALLGGFKGVAYVTILHTSMKILGVIILVWVALSLSHGVRPVMDHLPAYYFTWDGHVGATTIVAWLIGNVGAIFSTQYIVQAIASNRNANAARRSAFYAAILCLPMGLALGFIGVAARYLYPQLDALYALPIFVQHMGPASAAIVTTSLVASVFVGVSTVSLAMTALIVRDFYSPYFQPTVSEELKAAKIISLFVGVAPMICVFFVPEVLKLSFFTQALRLPITVVALIGLYAPAFATKRGAVIALLVSVVLTSCWYFWGNPYHIDNMYIALFSPLFILGCERLISARYRGALAS